jgi:arylsulfatase A-like enzyme
MQQQPGASRPDGPFTRPISRRALLRYGLAAAGTAALADWPPAPRAQDRARLLILVIIDTLRWDALGCHGNPQPVTPAIDALAADGVRFEQAVSTAGWTLPAVASILTGTWVTIHGASGKGAKLTPIRKELPTLAGVLRQHGFRTLGWGNCAFASPLLGLDRGFDTYDARYAYNRIIRRADETVTAAIEQLPDRDGPDTFLFIHLFDPHLDYDPPAGYADPFIGDRREPPLPLDMQKCQSLQTNDGHGPPSRADIDYIRGVYHGEVRFADDQIARLVQELKRRDLYEACTLVVTADHGEEFWEHGGFEHGHTLYDELIHVPLILKLPGSRPRGERVVESQVRTLDIGPTLLQLAQIAPPESFDGTPLLPFADGLTRGDLPILSQSTLYGSEKLAWRTGPYKYIHDQDRRAKPGRWLFDLRKDPLELEDLCEARPELAESMRVEFEAFLDALQRRARHMSVPRDTDLSPRAVESLKSLGYLR